MKHIAIEGMDGVGKTTTSRLLAERLGVSAADGEECGPDCGD